MPDAKAKIRKPTVTIAGQFPEPENTTPAASADDGQASLPTNLHKVFPTASQISPYKTGLTPTGFSTSLVGAKDGTESKLRAEPTKEPSIKFVNTRGEEVDIPISKKELALKSGFQESGKPSPVTKSDAGIVSSSAGPRGISDEATTLLSKISQLKVF